MKIAKNASLDMKMFNFLCTSEEMTADQHEVEQIMAVVEVEAVIVNMIKTMKKIAIIPLVQVEI